MNPYLRLGLDLGPLVVFFVANSYFGIYVATGAIMAAVTVSIGIGYLIERKVTPMPIVTLALVLVFGGLTLWLEDETFIKIRPTIVYTMFTTVLFAGLYYGHSLIKMLLHAAFTLSEEGWRILTVRWAAMFAGLAVVNELVWRNFRRTPGSSTTPGAISRSRSSSRCCKRPSSCAINSIWKMRPRPTTCRRPKAIRADRPAPRPD